MNWLCKDCRAPFESYALAASHVREVHDRLPRTVGHSEAMRHVDEIERLFRKLVPR